MLYVIRMIDNDYAAKHGFEIWNWKWQTEQTMQLPWILSLLYLFPVCLSGWLLFADRSLRIAFRH